VIGWTAETEALPTTPGAYALLIELGAAVALPPKFAGAMMPKGRYCYLGNAFGPGGIRARCRRHLAGGARRHWHIDWLTAPAVDLCVLAFPGASECALVRALRARPGIMVPIIGFGSSDCARCPAHLVAIDRRVDARTIARWLAALRL
jgi:Uri superfamily endonuclease